MNSRQHQQQQPNIKAQEFTIRLGKVEDIAYTITRFPKAIDFSKWKPPTIIRKMRLEDDQSDMQEALGAQPQQPQQPQQRYKSEKQLKMEQRKEASQRHAREQKREYILEDSTVPSSTNPNIQKQCFQGKAQLPESSNYCLLVMAENMNEFICLPVNNEWVHFETRVTSHRAAQSTEEAEEAIHKNSKFLDEKMKSATSEFSVLSSRTPTGTTGGVGTGGRRGRPSGSGGGGAGAGRRAGGISSDFEYEGDDEYASSLYSAGLNMGDNEGFDYDGNVDDDEGFIDAEVENPLVYYQPPEDYDTEEEEENLDETGREMRRLLKGDLSSILKKQQEAAAAAEQSKVKSEEGGESSNSEEEGSASSSAEDSSVATTAAAKTETKKRGRGRPKKSETLAKTASSSTGTAAAESSGKRKQRDEASGSTDSAAKRVKIESMNRDELEKAVRQLFETRKTVSYKEFLKMFLFGEGEQKKQRMAQLVEILKTVGVEYKKVGNSSYLEKQ